MASKKLNKEGKENLENNDNASVLSTASNEDENENDDENENVLDISDEEYQGFINELYTNLVIQRKFLASGINDFSHDFGHAEILDFLNNVENLNTTSMSSVQFEKRRIELAMAVGGAKGNKIVEAIRKRITSIAKTPFTAAKIKEGYVPSQFKNLKSVADMGRRDGKIYDIYRGIKTSDGTDLLTSGGEDGGSLEGNASHFKSEDFQIDRVVGFNFTGLKAILNPEKIFPVNLNPESIVESLNILEDSIIRELNSPPIPQGEAIVDRSVKIPILTEEAGSKPLERFYEIHPVPVKIIGKRVYLPGAIKRATGGSVKVAILIDASNLSMKTIGSLVEGLTEEYGQSQQMTLLILMNNANLADSAMKLAKEIVVNDNLTLLFGTQKVGSSTSYPRPDDTSPVATQNKAIFNNFHKNISTKVNQKTISATIDFTEYAEKGTPIKTVEFSDLGEESEISKVGAKIVQDFLKRDGVVSSESMVRGNTKKMGDSNQAISLLSLDDQYYFCDIQGRPTDDTGVILKDGNLYTFTLRQLKKEYGFVLYLLTHDKVLLSIALLLGINILYTLKLLFRFSTDLVKNFGSKDDDDEESKSKSITWLIGFKNALDIQSISPEQITAAIKMGEKWLTEDKKSFLPETSLSKITEINNAILSLFQNYITTTYLEEEQKIQDTNMNKLLKSFFLYYTFMLKNVPSPSKINGYIGDINGAINTLQSDKTSTQEKYAAVSSLNTYNNRLTEQELYLQDFKSEYTGTIEGLIEKYITRKQEASVGIKTLYEIYLETFLKEIDTLNYAKILDKTMPPLEWGYYKKKFKELVDALVKIQKVLVNTHELNLLGELEYPDVIVEGLIEKTAEEIAANQKAKKQNNDALNKKLATGSTRITPPEVKIQWLYELLLKSIMSNHMLNTKEGGGKRGRGKQEAKKREGKEGEGGESKEEEGMGVKSEEGEESWLFSSNQRNDNNNNNAEPIDTSSNSEENTNTNTNSNTNSGDGHKKRKASEATMISDKILKKLYNILSSKSVTVLNDNYCFLRKYKNLYDKCDTLVNKFTLKTLSEKEVRKFSKKKDIASKIDSIFNHRNHKLIYNSINKFLPVVFYLDSRGRKYELTRKFSSPSDIYIEIPMVYPTIIRKVATLFYEYRDSIVSDSDLHLYFLKLRLHFYETKLIQYYEEKRQYQKFLLKELFDNDKSWQEAFSSKEIDKESIYSELNDNHTEYMDIVIDNYRLAFNSIREKIETIGGKTKAVKDGISLVLLDPASNDDVNTFDDYIDLKNYEILNAIREQSFLYGRIPELSRQLSLYIQEKTPLYYPVPLTELQELLALSKKEVDIVPSHRECLLLLIDYDELAVRKLTIVENILRYLLLKTLNIEQLKEYIAEANELGLFDYLEILGQFRKELSAIQEEQINTVAKANAAQLIVTVTSKPVDLDNGGNGRYDFPPGNEHVSTLSLGYNYPEAVSDEGSEPLSQVPLDTASPTSKEKVAKLFRTPTEEERKAAALRHNAALDTSRLLSPAASSAQLAQAVGRRLVFQPRAMNMSSLVSSVNERENENENEDGGLPSRREENEGALVEGALVSSLNKKENENENENENEDNAGAKNVGAFFMANLPPSRAPPTAPQLRVLTAAIAEPQYITIVDTNTRFYKPIGFLFTTQGGEQLRFDRSLVQIAGPKVGSPDLLLTEADKALLRAHGHRMGLSGGYKMTRKNRQLYRKIRKTQKLRKH